MLIKSVRRRLQLFCMSLVVTVMPAGVFAGEAQFINVFDKSSMTEILPGTMVAELFGDKIGVMTFYAGGASAPVSAGKSHYHNDEHVWFQFAGESDYWIDFGDGKTRELNGLGAGAMMHVPTDQQHRGGHGEQDHYMAMVLTPPGATTIVTNESGVEIVCKISGSRDCTEFEGPKMETIDLHDAFDFATAEFAELLKDQIYTRQGKLGPGLGQEALLFNQAVEPGQVVAGREAPEEEVAMVYQGRVKVSGCCESRELVRGDVFYCGGPLTYSGLG
ncbi:MAG: hypothetical protein J4A00_06135 [Gammaproteobacteria bacterium]|nr:hypothetical protein [Gammaproteobacteria bacterium]